MPFDPFTVSMPSGEGFFMISNAKATWIRARDTAGHEVCVETFIFDMQTYAWHTGPPNTPDFHFNLYTLNYAGGLLDDWPLDFTSHISCHTTTPYSFRKTFEPNDYKSIKAAEMLFPSTTWFHCRA